MVLISCLRKNEKVFAKAMWQKEINWFISTTTTAISAVEEDEKVFLVFFSVELKQTMNLWNREEISKLNAGYFFPFPRSFFSLSSFHAYQTFPFIIPTQKRMFPQLFFSSFRLVEIRMCYQRFWYTLTFRYPQTNNDFVPGTTRRDSAE